MEIKADTTDTTNSSNVSPSVFGWDFQVNAAIVLMLLNIKEATSIKVEGEQEDLEINLKSGNVIYAQAKSVFNIYDYSNVDRNLKKSLESLYKDSLLPNAEKLIYITNSPNPFNNQKTMHNFSSGLNGYCFDDFPPVGKKKINQFFKKKNYFIDTSKLWLYVVQFNGEEDNRYKVIKEKTNELINSFNLVYKDIGNSILGIWQNDFFHNASVHDRKLHITKSEMLWPLIVFICELNREDNMVSDCDDGDFEEIEHKYKTIINNKTERFSFIIKVVSSFNNYKQELTNTKERIKLFISENWVKYENEFSFPNDERNIKERVIKITLGNIIRKRYTIDKIKKEVNL